MLRIAATLAILTFLLPASAAVDFQPLSYSRDEQPVFQRAGLRVYGDSAEECDEKMKNLASLQEIAIFGEDTRRPIEEFELQENSFAGVIVSKERGGKIIGSATVITPPIESPENRNFDVIVSAAHVLFTDDCKLKSDTPGLRLPDGSYQKIDPKNIFLESPCDGHLDKNNDRAAIIVPRVKGADGNYVKTIGFGVLKAEVLSKIESRGAQFRVVAFDATNKRMSISDDCKLYTPNKSEQSFYGRFFKSDCDTEPGASGGGLIMRHNGKDFLVGVVRGSTGGVSSSVDTQTDLSSSVFSEDSAFNLLPEISEKFSELIQEISQKELAKQNTI